MEEWGKRVILERKKERKKDGGRSREGNIRKKERKKEKMEE